MVAARARLLSNDEASTTVNEIREQARYDGLRVRLVGVLGKARSTVQLDVVMVMP